MQSQALSATALSQVDHTRRTPALVAGVSLLIMAVIAPIAQFGVLKTLATADAAATVSNIAGSLGLFWMATVALYVVAVLDVVVAWALYSFTRSIDRRLALTAAILRVIYAALFALVLLSLVAVAQAVGGASTADLGSEALRNQVSSSLASFDRLFVLTLGLFGLHLIALGFVLWNGAPRLVAALVVIGGLGYIADAVAVLVAPSFSFKISTLTFIGEVVLLIWLLWVAFKGVRARTA